MTDKFLNGLIVGLEIFASITGGLAIFTGLAKLFGNSKKEDSEAGPTQQSHVSPDPAPTSEGEVEDSNDSTAPAPETVPPKMEIISNNGGDQKRSFSQKLGKTADICVGLCEVVGSLGTLVGTVGRVFNKTGGGYSGFSPQPMAAGPGNCSTDKDGDPFDVPIFKGNDPQGRPIYWIKRRNGVIEVY